MITLWVIPLSDSMIYFSAFRSEAEANKALPEHKKEYGGAKVVEYIPANRDWP